MMTDPAPVSGAGYALGDARSDRHRRGHPRCAHRGGTARPGIARGGHRGAGGGPVRGAGAWWHGSSPSATAAAPPTPSTSRPSSRGHFLTERGPLPAIALTVDTSIAHRDRQRLRLRRGIRATGDRARVGPADLVVAHQHQWPCARASRTGITAARAQGARTWALTGGDGGRLLSLVDRAIVVPSIETARIQELHITVIHAVCAIVDDWWVAGGRTGRGS